MKNRDKFTMVTFFVVFIVYNIIGYPFDIDVLRFVTLREDGFGMSFVGILAPLAVTCLIYLILKYLKIIVSFND